MSKSGKGSNFEREICVRLSEWWSLGKRDDLFWRTSQSGGRATVRHRKGKQTHGQYGDITATHPKGNSLVKRVSIELKVGYSSYPNISLSDTVDRLNGKSTLEEFIQQARRGAKESGCPYWWLIFKQDRRAPMIYMPGSMARQLSKNNPGASLASAPSMGATLIIKGKRVSIGALRLDAFLENFSRSDILLLT